jgi:hypothetical protein
MERHGNIHVRELILRIEVGRVGDCPPAILVGVNVPNLMNMPEDVLGIDPFERTSPAGLAPAKPCTR